MDIKVQEFFDKETYTLSYIVYDRASKDAVIIDPVLDYDQFASEVSNKSVKKLIEFIQLSNLKLHCILETHAHADHFTGAMEIKKSFPKAIIAIGEDIVLIQKHFKTLFNLKNLDTTGAQFDKLIKRDETFFAGSLKIESLFTPGHTPACTSFKIGNHLFTGDTLFMPDYGTGRCDFPMGSAKELYNSISNKLYALSDETIYYTAHDYLPAGRELRFKSTIGESKRENIQLKSTTTQEEFIVFRENRDKTLSTPKLILPSIQINIDAGVFPKREDNGISYIKIPLL